jgi:hypothetical protein
MLENQIIENVTLVDDETTLFKSNAPNLYSTWKVSAVLLRISYMRFKVRL